MDILKMQEILSNYKKILGEDCDSCISQENDEMLIKVTGKSSFLNNMGFLLNVIKYIEENGRALGDNTEVKATNINENIDIGIELYKQWYLELKAENENLSQKVSDLENLIETYNKCYLQQTKLKTGEKIAYKEQASIKEVKKLKKAGLSYDEIADKLGVSRSTIYRRIKEII